MTKGKTDQAPVTRTPRRGETSSALARIRKAAQKDEAIRFTNLLHHITTDLLRESYHSLKRKAAPGVDEVSWKDYGKGLEKRLADLHERVQKGRYRARPSKRIWLPKPDGRQRPIGIAATQDKLLQHAMSQVLNQIYEEDFANFSYGFRPGRKPHDALDALWVAITQRKVSWVLDADISGFFDNINHDWLMKFAEHRIADQRVLRVLRKWLRAGVSEDGEWSKTIVGTPQGAVISPLLGNIYLHYVLDLWVKSWRKRQARGEVIIVRYADDFVVGFQHRADAQRFLREAQSRFAKFGLALNQEKTHLIEFGRFAASNRAQRAQGKPETFDFLGFTHICAKTRKSGRFTVGRKSNSKKVRAKVKAVKEALLKRRHEPVPQQGKWLRSVIQGHFNYYAVPGNTYALGEFRTQVIRAWYRALRRRSHKARRLNWPRMKRLIATWIIPVKVLHPYPNQRLVVTHPR